MNRKENVLMLFDFLIELLTENKVNEPVNEAFIKDVKTENLSVEETSGSGQVNYERALDIMKKLNEQDEQSYKATIKSRVIGLEETVKNELRKQKEETEGLLDKIAKLESKINEGKTTETFAYHSTLKDLQPTIVTS